MLDLNILKLMLKEEFRLQASFFNRSYFLASSLAIILFTFIMGSSLPSLMHAVAINDILLISHWVLLFYGLGVGGFALFGDRIMERRFGSISLLLGSGYTLPLRFRRLFLLFYIKDTIYYVFLTILPMILGLIFASAFVSISITSIFFLFVSLTLSFLLGIGSSVLMFSILALLGTASIGVIFITMFMGVIYTVYTGSIDSTGSGLFIKGIAANHPALSFYYSHSLFTMFKIILTVLILVIISSFFIKEAPAPHEKKAQEAFRKTVSLTSRLMSIYSPVLSKDIIDMVRSGIIFPVILTFLAPLLFLYAITWFVESVMLWNFNFSLHFYAAMVGFFCTLLYSWLSNIDISECYNSLPLSMPHVIRAKLILFMFFTCVVAVPYLMVLGYLKDEMDLLMISLFIMFSVSAYIGSVLSYLTGLFTNSYLLDAKILLQFSLFVVPVLLAETLLSFYYPYNSSNTTFYIAGLGLILSAASIIFLSRLNTQWKGKMFRIA